MAQDTKPAVRAHRVDLAITVDLKLPTLDAFVERFAPNLSRTGVFIRAKQPAAVGSRVRFEYRLADGTRVLRGIGLVRASRPPAEAREPDAPPGMAIEFVDLDADSEQLVARVVARFGEGARAPRRSTPSKAGPGTAKRGARTARAKLSYDDESQLDSLLQGLGSGTAPAAPEVTPTEPAPITRPDGLTPAWIEATAAGIAAESTTGDTRDEAGGTRDDDVGEPTREGASDDATPARATPDVELAAPAEPPSSAAPPPAESPAAPEPEPVATAAPALDAVALDLASPQPAAEAVEITVRATPPSAPATAVAPEAAPAFDGVELELRPVAPKPPAEALELDLAPVVATPASDALDLGPVIAAPPADALDLELTHEPPVAAAGASDVGPAEEPPPAAGIAEGLTALAAGEAREAEPAPAADATSSQPQPDVDVDVGSPPRDPAPAAAEASLAPELVSLLGPDGDPLPEPADPVIPTSVAALPAPDHPELLADLSGSLWRGALVGSGEAFAGVGDAVRVTAGEGDEATHLPSPLDWLVVPWPAPRARAVARRLGLTLVDDESGFPAVGWRGLTLSSAALLQGALEKMLSALAPEGPPARARVIVPATTTDAARRLLLRQLAGLRVGRCALTLAPTAAVGLAARRDTPAPTLVIEVLALEARLTLLDAKGVVVGTTATFEGGYVRADTLTTTLLAALTPPARRDHPLVRQRLSVLARHGRRAAADVTWQLGDGEHVAMLTPEARASALAELGESIALASDALARAHGLAVHDLHVLLAPEEPLWSGALASIETVLGTSPEVLAPDPWLRLRGLPGVPKPL